MFKNHLRPKPILAVVLGLDLLLVASGLNSAAVQTTPARGQQTAPAWISFGFVPPAENGKPRTNRAGGKRASLCENETPKPSLTLFIPPTNQGLTVGSHPTFWVYLPPTSAQSMIWKLEDPQNNYYYYTTLPVPETSGIVRLQLPETEPALEIGRTYKFTLAMTCGLVLDPSDPTTHGWIKRIEPNATLAAQQGQGTALEQATLYAQNSVWFDAFTRLADLRRAQPNNPDLVAAWEELLASVGLEAVQEAELLAPIQNEKTQRNED